MSLFGGKKKTTSTIAPALGSLNIQSQGYGNVVPIIIGTCRVSPLLFFYSNFKAIPVMEDQKKTGKGGKKKKQTQSGWSYTAAIMLGLACHEITVIPFGSSFGKLWVDKTIHQPPFGFTLFMGTSSQSAWGYLSTFEPAKAVALRGFSYIAQNNYALSDSAGLGNHSLIVRGACTRGTNHEASPADFIPWLLIHECGISAERIADMSVYFDYCAAGDVWFSFTLNSQQQASEVISEYLNLTSSELVIRSGRIHIIYYGQTDLNTGYALNSAEDFIVDQGQAPIVPTRKKAIDGFNVLRLEFLNRDNDYNIEIAEAKDMASIEAIGERAADTLTAHGVTYAPLARNLAEFLLQRDLINRNSYEFTLSLRYIRLEVMDVITMSDASLGLIDQSVIIKKIIFTPDFKLKITAEDYTWGVYQPTSYPPAYTEVYAPDTTVSAGNINPPVIFAAPAVLTATGYEVWCAISSSSALYGGCQIHLSVDGGSSYQHIATHAGSTRMGVLTGTLASGTSVDTVNTLAVDLTQSNGELSTVSQVSVDALETLCKVGNEFIAYRDAVLSSAAHYSLGYLRRSLYGSNQGAVTGESFVRCDNALFKLPYSPIYAGVTFKLKFVSYNIYEDGLQDLATVSAYDFTVPGTAWDNRASLWDSGNTYWIN